MCVCVCDCVCCCVRARTHTIFAVRLAIQAYLHGVAIQAYLHGVAIQAYLHGVAIQAYLHGVAIQAYLHGVVPFYLQLCPFAFLPLPSPPTVCAPPYWHRDSSCASMKKWLSFLLLLHSTPAAHSPASESAAGMMAQHDLPLLLLLLLPLLLLLLLLPNCAPAAILQARKAPARQGTSRYCNCCGTTCTG
jgi:hypothetical protein